MGWSQQQPLPASKLVPVKEGLQNSHLKTNLDARERTINNTPSSTGEQSPSSLEAIITNPKADEELNINRQLKRFTGWLVIVGGLQFIALIAQAIIIGITLRENRRLIDANRASADAATVNATATKALVEVGQRPWVSVQGIDVKDRIDDSCPTMNLVTTFLNSGVTPAMRVLAYYYYLFLPGDFPDLPAYTSDQSSTPIPFTISAREQRLVTVRLALPNTEVARWINGDTHLYIYGLVTYGDGFGKEHQTQWCNRYDGGVGKATMFTLTGKHEAID
jgi:hypothetical protein